MLFIKKGRAQLGASHSRVHHRGCACKDGKRVAGVHLRRLHDENADGAVRNDEYKVFVVADIDAIVHSLAVVVETQHAKAALAGGGGVSESTFVSKAQKYIPPPYRQCDADRGRQCSHVSQ